MDDAQNPSGQAPTLDAAQRKALKAQAHPLKPVVMIGDAGLSESVLAEIERALASHELIKIRVLGDDRDARIRLLSAICEQTGSAPVQHIGKLLVVWRPSSDADRHATDATAKRRKPKLPYQPKKAAGAGQIAPTRRLRSKPTTAGRAPDGESGPRTGTRPARTGARNSESAKPLARGAAIGKTGSRARAASPTGGKAGDASTKPAARKRYGAPVSTERAPRPGRAPQLASPGARVRVATGRKR